MRKVDKTSPGYRPSATSAPYPSPDFSTLVVTDRVKRMILFEQRSTHLEHVSQISEKASPYRLKLH
jgi:hypothetical protein